LQIVSDLQVKKMMVKYYLLPWYAMEYMKGISRQLHIHGVILVPRRCTSAPPIFQQQQFRLTAPPMVATLLQLHQTLISSCE
jgi:hypothetical protein